MAVIDIVCIAILVVFAIIGAVEGFARQILKFASGFVAIIGACLLLKPVFDLLYTLDFFKGIVDSLGNAFAGLTFLESYAATVGKTSGTLLGEYVAMAIVFIVLAIVLGLVWKLLKKICLPICDLKFFRVFDKIFGFVLGIFWGALLAFGLLYIASLVAPKVDAVASIYNSIVVDSSYVKTYIADNFNLVTDFFVGIWNFIKTGIAAAA